MTLFDLHPALFQLKEQGVRWQRYASICRSHYEMLIDGKPNGLWIRAVPHPTALRPYYVVLPSGRMLARKFSRLTEAKSAAIASVLPQAALPKHLKRRSL